MDVFHECRLVADCGMFLEINSKCPLDKLCVKVSRFWGKLPAEVEVCHHVHTVL